MKEALMPSKEFKTIREIAEENNVSRQRVLQIINRQLVDNLPDKQNGSYYLNKSQEELILKHLKGYKKLKTDNSDLQVVDKLLTTQKEHNLDLKKQLLAKDNQIKSKDKQLDAAQKIIDQSQQLQLDLQQKLTQHSSEVEQLKLENKIIQEELAQEKAKSFWQKLFHK